MLVTHVRTYDRVPFATLVAVDRDKIGLSICNECDTFVKKRGVEIAKMRAIKGCKTYIPNRIDTFTAVEKHEDDQYPTLYAYDIPIIDIIDEAFDDMLDRAARYFKSEEDKVILVTPIDRTSNNETN